MAVVAAIPWKLVLQAIPVAVVTAKQLWNHWSSRAETAPVGANADVKTQLASLTERVAALEGAQTKQAKLVSEMAEQLQGIARRTAIAYWLGAGGLLLSCAALLAAIFR